MSLAFHNSLKAKGVGAKDWANSWTEVEYLGDGKFSAGLSIGHRVFKDKVDGRWKKHKLTDERPAKDYVLVQGAKCCVEVYPFYAKYFDVHHEEVRLYEERWVVERLFKAPDEWRDVDTYNPVMVVEETENGIVVTVSYITDYGSLVVKYIQRDGSALKHDVIFVNTSGSTQTFRVLQRWAGIVGDRCNGKDIPIMEDASFFAFHSSDKPSRKFNIAENLWSIVFNPDRTEKTDQCLQRPVSIETHAQGMKADFIYVKWTLAQGEGLEIDPLIMTITPPSKDNQLNQYVPDTNEGSLPDMRCSEYADYILRPILAFDVSALSGFVISLATLRLYFFFQYSSDTMIIGSHRCYRETTWTELGSTWNKYDGVNDWTAAGGDYDAAATDTATLTDADYGWKEWDVKSIVDWALANTEVASVLLKSQSGPVQFKELYAKEYNGYDPELYVEYAPPAVGAGMGAKSPILELLLTLD